MRIVISTLVLAAALIIGAGYSMFQYVPRPIATAVIGEKGDKTVGNQAAQVLPAGMTNQQHKLLNMAYEVGKQNGFKDPAVMQALLLQESTAGSGTYRVANAGPEAYFGPMQVKLATAKHVLSVWPQLFTTYGFQTRTDDEIKANLILNDRFNIDVAAKYVRILKDTYGFTGRDLFNAYNRGPGGVKAVDSSFHYGVGVEQKLSKLKGRS